MFDKKILGGTVHTLPPDLKKALLSNPKALKIWGSLTPLARNEWICWDTTVKQPATRKNHIERTISELLDGMRRPCCWIGCTHRKDKVISPSVQWVLSRNPRNK